jgi:D-3-phosphoglycerate dehydrogenase
MKAVFIDCTPELKQILDRLNLAVPDSVQIHEGNPSGQEIRELCADADVLLVEHTVLSKETLEACTKLKSIVFMGTGAATYIPVQTASAMGIEVRNTPGYANRAVAEHAMALVFAAARNIARMDREMRAGNWVPRGGLQLQGRKAAVIGLGGIGEEFAEMARALGLDVAGWNHSPRDLPYYVADLDLALRDADVVSLHLALTPETEGILDAARLDLLKPGAILVNTARAQLVDPSALEDALKVGRIGHAALDVFVHEPLPSNSAWYGMDNVTLTPHAAYMTDDAYAELWQRTVAEVRKLESTM